VTAVYKGKLEADTHPSHLMSGWEPTDVYMMSNAATTGLHRHCVMCGHDQAYSDRGSWSHEELEKECKGDTLAEPPA